MSTKTSLLLWRRIVRSRFGSLLLSVFSITTNILRIFVSLQQLLNHTNLANLIVGQVKSQHVVIDTNITTNKLSLTLSLSMCLGQQCCFNQFFKCASRDSNPMNVERRNVKKFSLSLYLLNNHNLYLSLEWIDGISLEIRMRM